MANILKLFLAAVLHMTKSVKYKRPLNAIQKL